MSRASNLAGFSTSIQSVAPNNLVVGVITATSFVGDGSGLTNAGSTLSAGSGSQRVVLTSLTSGTMTTAATDADLTWNSTTNVLSSPTFSGNITGTAATFTGNVSIAGTLTYEDVTNVDSVGLITARTGVRVTAGGLVVTAGVTTLTDNTLVGSGITLYASTGIVSATSFYGSGANLTGLPASGVTIQSAGSPLGSGITSINFQSGATVTASGAGSTITISAGIQTAAYTPSGITTTLRLSSAQDHKVTATGITTITVSGGTEGDSHTVRIVNSGIATVGFSTYFLFPSGSPPVLPTASGAISLLSFTVHRVGTAGTQLLAGASLNFS
jgi:hypothetical protein